MKSKIIISFLLLCYFTSFSQKESDFEYAISSKAFNKERKIYVHVPEDYYNNKIDTFGVIYVLDGQGKAYYNNAKSIIDYLVWSYQIMPVIVVGIHSDNRHKEFVPKDRTLPDSVANNSGQSHILQAHIKNEVFPLIQNKFRITEFKALVGHSRGGAFVANTIFSDNKDMFNAYLAISPGMDYINNQILKDAKKMISSKAKFNKFYYSSYGTIGSYEKYFKPQVDYLDSLFQKYPNNTIIWRKKEIKNTTHWGTVAPSLTYGLLEMNRAYQPDQLLIDNFVNNNKKSLSEQVENYYITHNKTLGYTIPISAGRLRYYGAEYTEDKEYKKAIEVLKLSLKTDPMVNTYWDLGWVYKTLKEKTLAKNNFEKALQLLDTGKMPWDAEKTERWKKNIQEELKNY